MAEQETAKRWLEPLEAAPLVTVFRPVNYAKASTIASSPDGDGRRRAESGAGGTEVQQGIGALSRRGDGPGG